MLSVPISACCGTYYIVLQSCRSLRHFVPKSPGLFVSAYHTPHTAYRSFPLSPVLLPLCPEPCALSPELLPLRPVP